MSGEFGGIFDLNSVQVREAPGPLLPQIRAAAERVASNGGKRESFFFVSHEEWLGLVQECRAMHQDDPDSPEDEASGKALFRWLDPAGGPHFIVLIERRP